MVASARPRLSVAPLLHLAEEEVLLTPQEQEEEEEEVAQHEEPVRPQTQVPRAARA